MPVRKIPRSHTTVQGQVHFNLRGWHLRFESPLERDFFILQFFDEHVVDIEEQPVTIDWQDENNRKRHYTPDARIDFADGSVRLFEIKPKRFLQKHAAELAPKFAAAKSYAEQRGWKFCIVSEDDIRIPRLDNSKFLYPFASEHTPPHHAACFFHALRAKGETASVTALLEHVGETQEEQDVMRRSLWQMLAQGKLLADLDSPINDNTVLRLNKNAWFILQEQVS